MTSIQRIQVGQQVFVTQMPASSHYVRVLGEVTAIKNGFATIRTTSVKSRYAQEWKAHECVVGALAEACEAQ